MHIVTLIRALDEAEGFEGEPPPERPATEEPVRTVPGYRIVVVDEEGRLDGRLRRLLVDGLGAVSEQVASHRASVDTRAH